MFERLLEKATLSLMGAGLNPGNKRKPLLTRSLTAVISGKVAFQS